MSCFAAFSSDSHPASGVLQGLIGIYERRGIRGYYNGMGASFVRAIPCALINYTLTRKFENLVSSTESWDLAERVFFGTQKKTKTVSSYLIYLPEDVCNSTFNTSVL